VSATPDVGIAVVGAGRIAANYHLPALSAAEGARLVAVADIDEARAQEVASQFGYEHAFADYRRVLDRKDVDAICLFTQYEARAEVVAACAAAGKHVFTQKPLAGTVKEGEAMVAAANKARIRLVTSFMHNYFPETRLTKQLLDDGAIGSLVFMRQRNATRNSYERALELRGATWDIGPHGIGMIHHLTGTRITRVQAMMDATNKPAEKRDIRGGRAVDTLAVMNYTLSDGRLVAHEVQWTSEAGTLAWSSELFGETGGILLRPHTAEGPVALSKKTGSRERAWEYPTVEPETPRGLFHHQLFIDDLRYDRHQSATAEDGLATLRVLEAAYRSAETGLPVNITH
jgi:myo-inositol 2-dehydrogenase/D-chiro-inositol 1-dehydrogenase